MCERSVSYICAVFPRVSSCLASEQNSLTRRIHGKRSFESVMTCCCAALLRAQTLATLLLCSALVACARAEYRVGVGIADVTGPATEIIFMGYAHMEQRGNGVHLRQFSRAFIVDDGESRFVFVSVDCGMIGNGLRKEVMDSLRPVYKSVYTERNVMISGTHTHSGPGGYLQDLLFDLSTLGFVRETFEALVGGISLSIHRAHNNMVKGRLYLTKGELLGVSVNRSPTAYLNNPEAERRKYTHDTDKTMVQLRLVDEHDVPLGVINWYAVHATSMNYSNTFVSSDNLGYASVLFERRMNGGAHPGKGKFVAAFGSSNEGDVSPNTREPRCIISGEKCDVYTSACKRSDDKCVASGPGRDMFDSTKIIATRLADKAWELWKSPKAKEVKGPVHSVHQFVDMPTQRATHYDEYSGSTTTVKGCLPAMGYSFGAGTTDGPGAAFFRQGTRSDNALWNAFRDLLAEPTPADVKCHHPKPILLATGSMNFPFEWQPRIVSTMLGRMGDLVLACVPGEFTTMSGRRMRTAVKDALVAMGLPDSTEVVIAGLCNTYSDYITTPEEYQVQRYEGASTIYGPHTLPLYLAQYRRLAGYLAKREKNNDGGPEPPELMSHVLSLQTPVVYDSPPWGRSFGEVTEQPAAVATPGTTVRAVFVSGNPRNNMRHGASYLTVERFQDQRWVIEATDAYWETRFLWERKSTILGTSHATVYWDVDHNTPSGAYRIRHFGHYKAIFGGVYPYVGCTRNFTVNAGPPRASYGSGRRVRSLTHLRGG